MKITLPFKRTFSNFTVRRTSHPLNVWNFLQKIIIVEIILRSNLKPR